MEQNYDKLIEGYKKSLEALYRLDLDAYNSLKSVLGKFSNEQIKTFFQRIHDDMVSQRRLSSENGSLSYSERDDFRHKVISLYYDRGLNLNLEIRNTSVDSKYAYEVTLYPIMQDIANFSEGEGICFYEKTSNNEKYYNFREFYCLVKNKNGEQELCIQDVYTNITKTKTLTSKLTGQTESLVK